MPRKKEPSTEFGRRLVQLRQARSLAQTQLAELAGTSQRVISHYETVAEYPAVEVLIAIAHVLHVTTDELLGPQAADATTGRQAQAEDVAVLRRLRLVSRLPERDKRAVLRLIDTAARASA